MGYFKASIEMLIEAENEASACDAVSEGLRPTLREFTAGGESDLIDWRYAPGGDPAPSDGEGFEYGPAGAPSPPLKGCVRELLADIERLGVGEETREVSGPDAVDLLNHYLPQLRGAVAEPRG